MTDVAGVTSARDKREERWRGGGEHQEGRGRLCVCLCVCVGGGRIAIVKGMSLLLEWACWSLVGMGLCRSES